MTANRSDAHRASPPSPDVLVIGGGNAALCAALSARSAGARVVVLEAAPRFYRGGNTRHTRNLRVAHAHATEFLTEPYSGEEFWQDLKRVTAGHTDEALARIAIDGSEEAMAWLMRQGVRFQPALGGTLSLGRTNAFFLGGGRAMLNALYIAAEDLGVDIIYEAEVTALDVADGRFRAALYRHCGTTHELAARALVAASGGFEANIAWLKEGWGDAADNFVIRGTPYNRGLPLRLLLECGVAGVGDPTQCHAVAVDARAPKFDGGIVTRLDCIPFGIVVDRDAQRFYDEGEDFWPKRYAIWGRLVAQRPEQIAFVIIDSKAIDLFMPSVFAPVRADSLEALAAALGLDGDRLVRTIAGFNAACRPGRFDPSVHDDCATEGLVPPKSHWARPIDTPPFYAYPLRPGITFTYLGLRVDVDACMLMRDGRAADNMFAAGEIMAGNILGQGYLAGMGMTIGTVFGRIAGKAAAHRAIN